MIINALVAIEAPKTREEIIAFRRATFDLGREMTQHGLLWIVRADSRYRQRTWLAAS